MLCFNLAKITFKLICGQVVFKYDQVSWALFAFLQAFLILITSTDSTLVHQSEYRLVRGCNIQLTLV